MNLLRIGRRMLRKDQPVQVILFVTARCNFRCSMCFYWEPIEGADHRTELRLAEIEALARSMQPFPWLQIAGGEPFIRKDLVEIVGTFARLARLEHVTIPTNGWFTREAVDAVRRICEAHPRLYVTLDLSLEGLGATHDEIVRMPGAFARWNETYAAVADLRARHANLGLGAIFALSRDSQPRWRETLRSLVHDYRFDSVVIAKTRGRPKDPGAADVDVDAYVAATRYLEDAVRAGDLPGFRGLTGKIVQAKDVVLHRMVARISRGAGYQIPCYAGRISAVISETGVVYPCEILDRPIGDLRQQGMDFQAVWSGASAESARREIADTRCFCTHECFLTTNILFNPALLPELAGAAAGNALGAARGADGRGGAR